MGSRFVTGLTVLLLAACSGGDTTEPPRPAALEIAAAQSQNGTAGLPVPTTPSFIVKDQHGSAMAGVPVSIAVTGGGGSIANAPTASAAGATSAGTWTLGQVAGDNQLTITVSGITPVSVTAKGAAGAAAKITATSQTSLTGVVDSPVFPELTAVVTDQFGNVTPGAGVVISATAGSTVPPSVVSTANGAVLVTNWVLGTVRGDYELTMTVGFSTIKFLAHAKPGPATAIVLVAGDGQSVPAATIVSQPIQLRLRDKFDNAINGEELLFRVAAGGGFLAGAVATTNENGIAVVPSWTLGKTAVPQAILATLGDLTATVSASVQTAYHVDLRFYGTPVSESRQAIFTSAVARLKGIITGDVPDVQATNLSVSVCGASGVGPLTEIIDDVIIYAAVETIDGPGKVLGSAGPCYVRLGGGLPVIGRMRFDVDDIGGMEADGRLADVILHEMLHILGIGTIWGSRGLVNTTTHVYSGANARQGCVDHGGAGICSTDVPVENTGGPGTIDSHWRESTFATEVMTGFSSAGLAPFSLITIGGLLDLGYSVNTKPSDAYQVPGTGLLGSRAAAAPAAPRIVWEELSSPLFTITRTGRVARIESY